MNEGNAASHGFTYTFTMVCPHITHLSQLIRADSTPVLSITEQISGHHSQFEVMIRLKYLQDYLTTSAH